MGIAYQAQGPRGLSIEAWVGEISRDQAQEHLVALAALPEWGATGRVLTDLSGMSPVSLPDREQVAALAREFESHIADHSRTSSWAVVANVAYKRASEFGDEIAPGGRRLSVFYELESACIWLGVDVADVRPALKVLRDEARQGFTPI
jgi:hypothetical protein